MGGNVEYGKQTNEIRRELNKLNLRLNKAKDKQERKDIYGEFKMLRKNLRQIEQTHINNVLSG